MTQQPSAAPFAMRSPTSTGSKYGPSSMPCTTNVKHADSGFIVTGPASTANRKDNDMACEHGEPRGSSACPLCRYAGIQAKQEGLSIAESSDAAQVWLDSAIETIKQLARTGRPFTAEDVTDIVGLPGGSNKAVGAAMNRVARTGLIYRYGERPASRTTSHRRMLAVWRGGRSDEQQNIRLFD